MQRRRRGPLQKRSSSRIGARGYLELEVADPNLSLLPHPLKSGHSGGKGGVQRVQSSSRPAEKGMDGKRRGGTKEATVGTYTPGHTK